MPIYTEYMSQLISLDFLSTTSQISRSALIPSQKYHCISICIFNHAFITIMAIVPQILITRSAGATSTNTFILSPTKGANGRILLTVHIEQVLARARLLQADPAIMDAAPRRTAPNTALSPTNDASPTDGSPKVQRRIALLRELRAPPFKYAWGFYHDKHSDGDNYEGRLTLMKDNIITVKPFWEVLNSFPLNRLQLKDSVHFFKRGVKPVWEDPRNVKGGSWTFRVPKAQAEEFWKELLMMAVGEQFADVIQPGKLHSFFPSLLLHLALSFIASPSSHSHLTGLPPPL